MLGYYLHIPFCDKKCTYCDFYSIESKGLMERFVGSLCNEISLRGMGNGEWGMSEVNQTPGTRHQAPISSIFFGGGTPSLLSPDQLRTILEAVRSTVTLADDCEITMECNPGTITLENLIGYREAGINRLSFGVQSFVEEELRFLTRIHSADEADDAMRLAREAGFNNVNMDLMFALPPQTMESLSYNIDRMLALDPDHISAYSLVYEPGTPLHAQKLKGAVQPHPEELDADMYTMVMERLGAAGYEQYEVSNFAKPGRRCRHNLTYWHGEDYIAVGPSAHGLVDGLRYWNHRSLTAWTEKVEAGELPHANTETLGTDERLTELAFLTLRADGMPIDQFTKEFGIDLRSALQPDLGYWMDDGMVIEDNGRLRLTPKGYQVCDLITVKVEERLN